MNQAFFTEGNLNKVLDNIVYNIIGANNAVDEPAHVWMGDHEICLLVEKVSNIYALDLCDSLKRLEEQNCIYYDKNKGYRTVGFGGNFPEPCIEHY